jgi:hypothetical protein
MESIPDLPDSYRVPVVGGRAIPPSGRFRNRCTAFARFDSFEEKEGVAGAGVQKRLACRSHSERANVGSLSREMILSRSVASLLKQCRHGYFRFDESARIAD